MKLGPDELSALARKYRTLAALRASNISDHTPEERAKLKAIAKAFPGALRELDSLATDEIDRRAEALEAAAAGGPQTPWMAWMHDYHALMRAALKLRAGRPTAERLDELSRELGLPIDAAFAAAIARPPHGRMMVVVFDRLGARFGVPARAIWDALFPSRKGRRHYRG